jgi:putative membrane protein insertion efficiency factor
MIPGRSQCSIMLLVLLSLGIAPSRAQHKEMWDFSKKKEEVQKSRKFLAGQFFFLGQIKLYQLLLSEQQPDACNFTPSCSHYAYEAIKKRGPLTGSLMAVDRLQRCNPWAWNYHGTYYGVIWVPGRGYKLLDPP